jgi:hypothetical protein
MTSMCLPGDELKTLACEAKVTSTFSCLVSYLLVMY